MIVSPEVAAPNRFASAPESMRRVTPGIEPALDHRLLFVELPLKPGGRTNITNAASLPPLCAIRIASSPILAREHGQCG